MTGSRSGSLLGPTRYGALELDVPPSFDDETVIVLKAPAVAGVPMLAPTGEVRRPTLVVRRVPLKSDATLGELVEAEERVLALTVPELALGARGAREVGGIHAVTRELVFPVPDGVLRQLHVGLIAGGAFWLFIGTAHDDVNFPRDAFLAVIGSARFS